MSAITTIVSGTAMAYRRHSHHSIFHQVASKIHLSHCWWLRLLTKEFENAQTRKSLSPSLDCSAVINLRFPSCPSKKWRCLLDFLNCPGHFSSVDEVTVVASLAIFFASLSLSLSASALPQKIIPSTAPPALNFVCVRRTPLVPARHCSMFPKKSGKKLLSMSDSRAHTWRSPLDCGVLSNRTQLSSDARSRSDTASGWSSSR